MKKSLVIAAVLLLLCSCTKQGSGGSVRTVERYGRTYTIDGENQTIAYEGVVYGFDIQSSGGGGYSATFTAPDGSTSFWAQSGNTGYGGGSDDWDPNVWPSDLADALGGGSWSGRERSGSPLLGMLLAALGAFNALAPKAVWYLSHGWRYRNAEPSEAALFFNRAGGVFLVLFGIVLFFV